VVDEDFPKALDYLNKSLKIGEESNYLPSIVLSNALLGLCQLTNLEFPKTLHYFEKAFKINVAANALWGISATKAWIAFCHVVEGKINIGYDTSNEAVSVANQSGDNYSKSHAYSVHGWSNYRKGYLEKAEEYFLKVAVIPEKDQYLGFTGFAFFGLGMYYFQTQEYEKSKKNYERAISLWQYGKCWPSWVNGFKLALALTKVMNNENVMKVNEIFKCYDDIKNNWCKAEVLRCVSEILLTLDNQHISEAEDWIKKAIETHKNYGMIWHLARDYALYAELFTRKNDLPKAREKLGKAIEIFKECGADGWVEKYEKELSAL
jgi:tetratricopeptide (TPR) repeat protein